jgi:two-component system CitB family sensor kinase
MSKPRMSLARQLLVLQMLIIACVLVLVTIASYTQSEASFRNTEGRKLLSVAESLASSPLVRFGVVSANAHDTLAPVAENARAVSGATSVLIADAEGMVVTATEPADVGHPLDLEESEVLDGRSWVGVTSDDDTKLVVAHVPIIDATQRMIGVVAVGHDYPTWAQSLVRSTPNLLTYVGVASVVGVVGSLLLSRRIKRQTLGLEPREIAELAQHREAMLHGIKEGVLGLDINGRVTLMNDEARQLLRLPEDAVGKSLQDLDISGELGDVLTGAVEGNDLIVMWQTKILVLNRMPVDTQGMSAGSVTTLRDRTELLSLQHELDVTRNTTSALRAQAHEFTNRLHIIAGLVQLGRSSEVVRFITSLSNAQAQLRDHIVARIKAPALAALLIAKVSLATERGIELKLTENSRLGQVDEELEADLVTVVGNLVDNALDALPPSQSGSVAVEIISDPQQVRVVVADSGSGLDPALLGRMFDEGYTTKTIASHEHGIGLALVRMVCTRRGGQVEAANREGDEHGAVFSALLPLRERSLQ